MHDVAKYLQDPDDFPDYVALLGFTREYWQKVCPHYTLHANAFFELLCIL